VSGIALWPDSQPKPECGQRRDPRHEKEARVTLVLTTGPVPDSCRQYPTGPVVSSFPIERAGGSSPLHRRDPGSGREGFEDP
jgi:hypothetical protein